ncbi:MAG: hypothetical protein H6718_10105 [Polyangiaceae bacterium]|nr:hypothetical protein [Polyangiaceae bacterium]
MFNQQPKHGVIWSKLLGEWSRLFGGTQVAAQLQEQWLRALQSTPWPGVFPPGFAPSSNPFSGAYAETLQQAETLQPAATLHAELASQALGRWLHWVDASAWLAKDTLNYVQRLQVEFIKATQDLQAQSLDREHF